MFEIRLGIPEMLEFWTDLETKNSSNSINKDELKIYKNY